MSVSLDQILTLAGRLDEAKGFDSPRERFRRFLRDYVTDPATARLLIEQGHHAPDEQHLRAVEDLTVLTGQFLGFETAFAPAATSPEGPQYHGSWQAGSRLQVLVEARSAATGTAGVDRLIRAVGAAQTKGRATATRTVGLIVLAPLSAGRAKIEKAIQNAEPPAPISVVPVGRLLAVTEFVSAGRVAHADIVRVLDSSLALDFIADLVERSTERHPAEATRPVDSGSNPERANPNPAWWMASVGRDHGTTPEEFLELVVAQRHVFGVSDKGTVVGTVRPGDSICFYVPGKGVVGHADVASVEASGSGIRDARRFRQVLRLEDLKLHLASPIPLDPETELRLRAAPTAANRNAQILVEISFDSFRAMTSRAPAASPARAAGEESAEVPGPEGSSNPDGGVDRSVRGGVG